jgi:hypothetical protein
MSVSKRLDALITKEVKNVGVGVSIAMQYYDNPKLNNFDYKGKPANITEGYMVSFKGGLIVDKNDPKYETKLRQAIVQLLDLNVHLHNIGYIGFWENEGKMYVDLSVNILSVNMALTFGKLQDQVAIWDVLRSNSVNIADYTTY